MKRLLLLALFLVGCGVDAREWKQGDACTPADCGDMYCVTSRLPDGTDTPAMCMPTCSAGADCSTHCCLPLLGFDVSTCAMPVACGL